MIYKMDQAWERLREASTQQSNHLVKSIAKEGRDILRSMERIERQLQADIGAQQARFDSYLPVRSPDESHDAKCQKNTMGEHACYTCESNRTRHQQQIINAARARDYDYRDTLGGMEQHSFNMHVTNDQGGYLKDIM